MMRARECHLDHFISYGYLMKTDPEKKEQSIIKQWKFAISSFMINNNIQVVLITIQNWLCSFKPFYRWHSALDAFLLACVTTI